MEVTVPGGNGSSTRAESPATPALIMKLPSEILTEIFAGLTIKDMFSVVRVCKEWQQLGERGMLSSKLQVDMRHLAIKPNTVNRYIQKMKTCFNRVSKLDATRSNIGNTELESITLLQRLSSLNLSYCDQITDEGLGHLALLIPQPQIEDDDSDAELGNELEAPVKFVLQLAQLTSLNLRGCDKITDTGLEHVAQLTQLTSLDLRSCAKITDTGLEHVAQLTQLTSLNLSGCYKITDTGLEHVAQLTQLTSLDLYDCGNITDTGLEHVAQLTQLTSLDLSVCYKITDTGLEHVAQLTQLTSLDLVTVARSRTRGWSTLPNSRSSPA